MRRIFSFIGTSGRAFVALVGVCGVVAALANYTATQGTGITFGSVVISTVHYAQQLICDATTPSQCAAVSSGGAVSVAGTVTANAGTNLNTSALGTSANQATNAATTAHTCSTAGFSELGCLGQIDDDIKGSIPAGSALIGKVGIDQTTPGTTNGVQLPATQAGGVALGQALAAASVPVVLPAAQITTLTPPSNTGYATSANQSTDPCLIGTKVNFTISTTSGTLQLVAPSGSTQVYICSLFTIGATASIQNLVGGTGSTCTTGTPLAIAGSTTAASGMSFAANGGFTFGNGGGTILRTTTAGHGVCLIQSGTAQISGGGTAVQQ